MAAYTTVQPGAVIYRPPTLDDLETIFAIETASYPEDEAASHEKLKFRIENAPNVFLLAVAVGGQGSGGGTGGGQDGGDEIVGYVCGTCSSAASLTHESMAAHDPAGALLCVHSVCVAEPHRRKGVATKLLSAYMRCVAGGAPHVQEARLLCKQHNVGLYQRAGFELLGPSPVVHGAEQWLEMRRPLNDGGGGGGGASE